MNDKIANTLLGAFVLGGVVIALAFGLFILGTKRSHNPQEVIMVFDDSVKGLNIGAPIALRGVTIGEVTAIKLRVADQDTAKLMMEVTARIDGDSIHTDSGVPFQFNKKAVAGGLRAQLNSESLLTGLLYIQLDFFPEMPATYRMSDSELIEIPTMPSPFEQLRRQITAVDIPTLAHNTQEITSALAALTQNEALQRLPNRLESLLVESTTLVRTTQEALEDLRPQLAQTLASTAAAASTTEQAMPRIAADVEASLRQLDSTLLTLSATANQLTATLEPDSALMYELINALAATADALRTMQALGTALDAQPDLLLRGRSTPGDQP
jgi:paraquat-inducible protein B